VAAPATERTASPRRDRAILPGDDDLPVLKSVFELGQKNARGIHKGLPFRTNSAGFRGPEYSPEPGPGVFRIVVAGDSVTMGTGVLEEEAYAARLQRRLETSPGEARYEVLNLGLSGLNAERVVQRIETIGTPYQPDLIVYGFTLNDIEGPAFVSSIEKGSVPAKLRRYRRFVDSPSYLLRAVWPRLLAAHEIFFQPEGTLEYDYRFNYFENPRAWGDFAAALDDLAGLARQRDVCVLVLLHTGLAQLNRLYPFMDILEKVEAAAEERGFGAIQSFPWFQGRDPTQLRLSFWDSHPNAEGHAILTDALVAGLAELPEECWDRGPGGRPAALLAASH